MKKTFVKYFGVASATLLAASPAVTPALMTASNLQTVSAGVQDDINRAFKADNSIVSLSDSEWNKLTENQPKLGEPQESVVSLEYLSTLQNRALEGKRNLITSMDDAVDKLLSSTLVSGASTYDGLYKALTEGNFSAFSADNGLTDSGYLVKMYTIGDAGSTSSIISGNAQVSKWFSGVSGSSLAPTESKPSAKLMFPGKDGGDAVTANDKSNIKAAVNRYISKLPDWWFIESKNKPTSGVFIGDFVIADKADNFVSGVGDKFNTQNGLFSPKEGSLAKAENYVTIVPEGGTKDVVATDPSLKFAGDNITYLQKLTGTELLNLVPGAHDMSNPSGNKYRKVAGIFQNNGTAYEAQLSNLGSKAWGVILKSVFNSNYDMKTLYEITTSQTNGVKMLVNGKDATKSETISANEIKSADKISIQFVFDTPTGQYKSPLVWLAHNQKYSIDTSDLGSIVRRPGDYYGPNFNLRGIDNETGLALNPDHFVVVPAGTNMSRYYRNDKKATEQYIDLNALSRLRTGIQNSAAADFGNHDTTAVAPFILDDDHFWNTPNMYYSKYGTYSDAVDIYYFKNGVVEPANDGEVASRAAAADNAAMSINKLISDKLKTSENELTYEEIKQAIFDGIRPYLSNSTGIKVPDDLDGCFVNYPLDDIPSNDSTLIKVLGTSGMSDRIPMNKDYVTSHQSYPALNGASPQISGTLANVVKSFVLIQDEDNFRPNIAGQPLNGYKVKVSELHKVGSNVGRTTKVDVPSKYLPQVSFNKYNSKDTSFYSDGAVINNWYDYPAPSDDSGDTDGYYPSNGVVITGSDAGNSGSSAASRYLAPGAFRVNELTADQLKARVTDKVQNLMSAKLSNPNSQLDSREDGYFKGYTYTSGDVTIKGDAANAYIANGHVPAEDLKIDTSAVDVTKAGTYYATVTYTPLNSINKNVKEGQTNKFVTITDEKGNVFKDGHPTNDPFLKVKGDSTATGNDPVLSPDINSNVLSKFDADQIFANGAPATFKLPVEITDGSSTGVSGSPVIAFTEGGENVTIPKGGTFDFYKNIQFYAYPGAKPWDKKDSSLKVEITGSVNTNVEGKYTLTYKVTNSAGKSSTLTRVVTVGSGVEAPTEYDFNMSPAYIDYVPGYYVREYSSPRAEWSGKQVKHATSVSVTKKAVFQDGETWYKLEDGNWVKAEYVQSGNPTSSDSATSANGVVDINYVPGYGVAVYKAPGTGELVTENGAVKRLPHGTSWKSFKKQTVNGITYYNLGGNQWIDGRYARFH